VDLNNFVSHKRRYDALPRFIGAADADDRFAALTGVRGNAERDITPVEVSQVVSKLCGDALDGSVVRDGSVNPNLLAATLALTHEAEGHNVCWADE